MSDLPHPTKSLLMRLVLNPLFGGFTTVTGVIAGFIGAIHPEIVVAAHWPWFLPGVTLSWEATGFWVATALFGICFSSTFSAQTKASEQANEVLRTATARIEDQTNSIAAASSNLMGQVASVDSRTENLLAAAEKLNEKTMQVREETENVGRLVQRLHTLPPVGFLDVYASSGKDIVQIASESTAGSTVAELEALIRFQLVSLLKIIAAFDERGGVCRYGANLMVFRATAGLDANTLQELEARLKFMESTGHISKRWVAWT